MRIETNHKIEIINLPTTIRHLEQLSKELNGPQLYIKRDDQLDFSFEDRRLRNLQLIMEDAVSLGAQFIITAGELSSSYVYSIVTTAIHYDLKPIIIMTDQQKGYNDYYFMMKNIGADIYSIQVSKDDTKQEIVRKGNEKMREVYEKYEKEGSVPYIIPKGMEEYSRTVGNIEDVSKQIKLKGLGIKYIVKAIDSTSSFGIIILENKLFKTGLTPIGISVANKAGKERKKTFDSVTSYGIDLKVKNEEINIFNSIESYSEPPKVLGVKAIKLLAEKEAIFLDHSHNGRALAGLFNLIKRKYFKKEDGVLFIHTGDSPALSAFESHSCNTNM